MGDSTPQRDARSIQEILVGLNRVEQHRAAMNWAMQNHRVVDLFGEFAQERHLVVFQSGDECENWLDPIDNVLYKMNTLTHVGEDLVQLFKRIDKYNIIFPALALRFVGMQVMRDDCVFPVFAQPFISGARMATKTEILQYMSSLGFAPTEEDGKYTNGKTLLWDIKSKNVLVTQTGEIAVIDAEITEL